MKTDRLFLCKLDTESAYLRNTLNANKMIDDSHVGKNSQDFRVFVANSWNAFKDLKQSFKINSDEDKPVLETVNGKIIVGSVDIEKYLITEELI